MAVLLKHWVVTLNGSLDCVHWHGATEFCDSFISKHENVLLENVLLLLLHPKGFDV